jgi:hypothetical protein
MAPQMPDWRPYLDPDERILWQGHPAGGVRLTLRSALISAAGTVFLAFALFWMAGASIGLITGQWRTEGGFGRVMMVVFPLFGIPFVIAGLYGSFGHLLFDAWRRAATAYALTDRRALILCRGALTSWPIGPQAQIDYQPGRKARIDFATRRDVDSEGTASSERIGFHWIEQGDTVYRLIRRIQSQTTGAP